MVYMPREDSFLLEKQVLKHAKGKCLDIGTGSGIQALAAKKKCRSVLAVDIDAKAVALVKCKGIKAVKSNLFSNAKGVFDTIIFNPPYLPQDADVKDSEVYGGKHGYELIERFLSNSAAHLTANGQILLLFSSQTNKKKVNEIFEHNLLEFKVIAKQRIFFEELYVYKITKSTLLKKLEERNISDHKYLARGKRGIVYVGKLARKKVAVKVKRKDSEAIGRTQNEAKWLKLLNKHKIGPQLLFAGSNFICYKFVEGDFIADYIEKSSKTKIIKVLKDVFGQCRKLDKLWADKEEMHRPVKHVIIKTKPVLIDFERTRHTNKPKNVTQFCQFLISANFNALLKKKGIKINRKKMIELAKQYKKDYSKKHFDYIMDTFK